MESYQDADTATQEVSRFRMAAGMLFVLLLFATVYLILLRIEAMSAGSAGVAGTDGWVRQVGRLIGDRGVILGSLGVCMVTVFLFEHLIPAKPDQGIFNVSVLQDVVWFVVSSAARATLVVAYVYLLRSLYDQYAGHLTITAIGSWPAPVRFAWGVLLADFLAWFHHWVRHKVPWFWHFHAVHHSQRQLNMFTDFRYHIVEYFISQTLQAIPLFMLAVATPTVVLYSLFQSFVTRAYHGNIRTDLGPLRYLLVTPQSHRIHHSIEPQHFDKNFGVVFSIWDYVFGTQHRQYDEYPDTGIPDEAFPHETSARGVLRTLVKQHWYPFQAIARSLKRVDPRGDERFQRARYRRGPRSSDP